MQGSPPSFATSGAIILSDLTHFERMLWPGINAIEIGNLLSDSDLHRVLSVISGAGLRWGMHAPLWRNGPKRVLMAPSSSSEGIARHLRQDMAAAAAHKAAYVLFHAPWFADQALGLDQASALANDTVRLLAGLEREHGIPVVLELKLGEARDPGVLGYLMRRPQNFLDLKGLTLCLDIGDWLLACEALGVDPLRSYVPFAALTSVIHVHSVERAQQPYLWKPIHPSDPDAVAVRRLCELVTAHRSDVNVVFEHTPHLDPGLAYDLEGYRWLRAALTGSQGPDKSE